MTTTRPPQPPPFFGYTPTTLIEAVERRAAAAARAWDEVARVPAGEATFARVVRPLADDENAAQAQVRVLRFLASASPDPEVRAASRRAAVLLRRDAIERFSRADVLAVVDAVAARADNHGRDRDRDGGGDDGGLTPESRVLLRKLRNEFADNGLAVDDEADRARLKAVNLRLAEVQTQYIGNLNADVGGLWFTGAELDGLSAATLERFPQKQEEGDNVTRYFVSFKRPNMQSVLGQVHSAGTRRRYQVGWDNRVKDSNGPLLREMLRLRREAALLRGFRNYSESEDHNRMMSTEQVAAFMASVREPLKELSRKEQEKLVALKVAHLETIPPEQKDESSIATIFRWDSMYYKNIFNERKSKIDTEKVSEYFPLKLVLPKFMEIFSLLFGLRFVPLSPETDGIETWHEDVMSFALWDAESEGGEFVGYLFIDPYPRDGKYSHVGHFGLQPGFIQPDGKRHYPSSALMLNYPPPTASRPCLLKYREVVSCFHELGHAIHWLVSRTTYARFHGTLVARDFVEVPSRMLEHFFWDPNVIRAVSCHFSAEPAAADSSSSRLPEEVIAGLVAARFEHAASKSLVDLALATFDHIVHTTWAPARAPDGTDDENDEDYMDLSVLVNKTRREFAGLGSLEDLGEGYDKLHGQTQFRFIGGNYGASYYAYMNADTLSTDIFTTKFKPLLTAEPVHGDLEAIVNDAMRAEGRRYRYAVLEPGSSHGSEMGLIKAFLGRDPNPKAYVEVLAAASHT